MKKLIIAIAMMTALSVNAQSSFTIDTVTYTNYGINLPTGVVVQFNPMFGWGDDTRVIYNFKFYASNQAIVQGDRELAILNPKTRQVIYNVSKLYSPLEFSELNVSKMFTDAKEILENIFGNNNVK
jgi:hypothetical protein